MHRVEVYIRQFLAIADQISLNFNVWVKFNGTLHMNNENPKVGG